MMKQMKLKRQKPDVRDYKISAPRSSTLRSNITSHNIQLPLALDQGGLGACASNIASNVYRYLLSRVGVDFSPSRLYLYYNCRVGIEQSSPNIDSGVVWRDVFKAINAYGLSDEKVWSYDVSSFSQMPPVQSYKTAFLKKVIYRSIEQKLVTLKSVLLLSHPIMFGLMIYESFLKDGVTVTGSIPLPDTSVEKCMGGHAMVLSGFDDSRQRFIGQNCWSVGWGRNGMFDIPYEYILNSDFCFDFWIMEFVK